MGRLNTQQPWREGKWQTKIDGKWQIPPNDKYQKATWMAIADWDKIDRKPEVKTAPWRFMPHLHPRLQQDERTVAVESQQGSLFLENAVQLDQILA